MSMDLTEDEQEWLESLIQLALQEGGPYDVERTPTKKELTVLCAKLGIDLPYY